MKIYLFNLKRMRDEMIEDEFDTDNIDDAIMVLDLE